MNKNLKLVINNTYKKVKEKQFFEKNELKVILDLYAKMVSEGSWKDYGLNISSRQVSFSVFKNAAETTFAGIIDYTEYPIVSIDIIGNTHSCIFDSQMTSVIGKMVKIIGWYDNETGYSSRIIDLALKISRK